MQIEHICWSARLTRYSHSLEPNSKYIRGNNMSAMDAKRLFNKIVRTKRSNIKRGARAHKHSTYHLNTHAEVSERKCQAKCK